MSRRLRVYVDACVLILAARASEEEVAARAFAELDRTDVEYVYSAIVEHEVLPQPLINKRVDEVAFLKAFLDAASRVPCDGGEQAAALQMRLDSPGLHLVDALHLSAAAAAGATEFVTAEGLTKPMVANPPASIQPMKVRSIRADVSPTA